MKRLVLLLVVVACGKSEKSEPAKSDPKPAETKPAETKPVEVTPSNSPTAPAVEVKLGKDLCKKIDGDTLAKPLEVPAGLSRTGSGVLVKGGKEPPSLSCSYYEKGKTDGGTSFGFVIADKKEFEKRDMLGRFKWEELKDFGQPAMIGRAKDGGVHVQVVANGGLVIVNAQKDGMAAKDLEPKLISAAKTLLTLLPADAAAEIR